MSGTQNPHNPNASTSNEITYSSSSSLLWKQFDEHYGTMATSINPTATGIIELDRYFQEPLINRCEDPLNWWSSHKLLYPRLFKMFRKRLFPCYA